MLVFHGIYQPEEIDLRIDGAAQAATAQYDSAAETMTLRGITLQPREELRVRLTTNAAALMSRRDRRAETCRAMLRQFKLGSEIKRAVDRELKAILADPNLLLRHELTGSQADALHSIVERR